jgi:peptidylprolyl isomerase
MKVPRRWPTPLLTAVLLLLPGCGGDPDEKRAIDAPFGGGLKYADLSEGEGEPVKDGDVVEVRYTARVKADRKPFEGNVNNDRPALRFVVGDHQVVQGFDAGVVGMKSGGKRKLYVPSTLGYGSRGLTDKVPANADLVYEVELLKIDRIGIEDTHTGNGPEVTRYSSVLVDLRGMDSSGAVFSETAGHGPPMRFVIGSAPVRGLDLGLLGMKQGGGRRITIPPELAVFRGARPASAPADAELVYEVELLQVVSLEVEDLKSGSGRAVRTGDRVSVHYTGTLKANGQKFDSSLDRAQPFEFQVGGGQVIKGWELGVVGMKVGGKRKLIIPADLAYGDHARGSIPPGSDLVFEIELLAIK